MRVTVFVVVCLAVCRSYVDKRALVDTRDFRERFCYTQDVEEILKFFEASLRAIYTVYVHPPHLPRGAP